MKKLMAMIGVFLLLQSAVIPVYANHQPTRDEINEIIEEVALRKNIPPVILKAIAWKESRKTQFRDNSEPFVYYGNQGLMQVNNVHNNTFDRESLLYDVEYNIEAGADILLSKWLQNGIPTVGERDPDVLENWYFALWGYNGWLDRNNPHGGSTYQDGIFDLIRTRYDQPISDINYSHIPAGDRFPRGVHVPNPPTVHRNNLLFFEPGDIVEVEPEDLYLAAEPYGESAGWAPEGVQLRVLSEARLSGGIYFYELESLRDGNTGWAAGIYLKSVAVAALDSQDLFSEMGEPVQSDLLVEKETEEAPDGESEPDNEERMEISEVNEPVFNDMEEHPAREAVERLNAAGIVSGTPRGNYEPDRAMTRQELAVVFGKAFQFEGEEATVSPDLLPQDWNEVSDWAREPLESAVAHRIITGHPDGTIRPMDHATREQGLMMLTKALDFDLNEAPEDSLQFRDAHRLSNWALPAVNLLVETEILMEAEETTLNPNRAMTRAEMALLLDRVKQQGRLK